jgi:hypothetical protein
MIETRIKIKRRAANLAKSSCIKYLTLTFKVTKTLSISPVMGLGRLALTACLAAFVGTPALLESGAAKAQPYGNPIPPGPFVIPAPGFHLPLPVNVPGKEVSFGNLTALEGDRDQLFATAPGQAVFFDGVRRLPQSGLRNAWNFDGLQVDAMANTQLPQGGDVLFQAVRNDSTWLLFSVQNDRYGNAIFAEAPRTGKICLWSINGCKSTNNTPEVVGANFAGFGALLKNGNPSEVLDPSTTYPVTADGHLIDVDGLEVWGPEPDLGYNPGTNDPASDANVFSAEGDSTFSVKCRAANTCHTYFRDEIAVAIGLDPASLVDVDGLMTNLSGTLDPGGLPYLKMLFSVRPIGGLDGAEIWDWSGVPGDLAVPLIHGGHAWDTAFDLRGKLIAEGFGDMALSTTPLGQDVNLDAIEAASTVPGPLPLLGVGAAFGFSRNLRKRIKTSKSSEVISALG